MKAILEKLSSYNIFNYLFPGFLFVIVGEQLTTFSLFYKKWFIGVFLYYFYGLIISRIGSLIVRPLLKNIKFINEKSYEQYVPASKLDPKIEIFSEQNNMYRTLCAMFILLIILKICDELKDVLPWREAAYGFIFLVGLLILFLFSYRKQTGYVVERIEIALKKEKE